jgi:hypothetical protein
VSKCGYSISTEGLVTLAAATAKSVLGAKAGANVGLDLKGFVISFDGVTAAALPVLCELCYATFATNSPGTNSTGAAERQVYGRIVTPDFTGGINWTTEPTVLTPVDEPFLLDPNKGFFSYDYSLGESPDSAVGEGFVLRLNAPATVGVRAAMRLEHA